MTDNGSGMRMAEFKSFLCPNYSFKDGTSTRGSKGVGATSLAYGFNDLHVATRTDEGTYAGSLRNGRVWLEDTTQTISRPKVVSAQPPADPFARLAHGTSMTVRLTGPSVRPRDLG